MHLINEDRILDFLDGHLSGEAEEELLHTLAVSPERRTMLRDHLKLRELTTTLSRQERFTVPEHVTAGLFTQLAAIGFSAPVSTTSILTNAPELVKMARQEEPAAAIAYGALRTFGRLTFSSLLTVSVISFLLGVGAFYVFGSSLGLRTASEERQAAEHTSHAMAANTVEPIHRQFVQSIAEQPAPVSTALHSVTPFGASLANPLAGIPMPAIAEIQDARVPEATTEELIPIGYTTPRAATAAITAPDPTAPGLARPTWLAGGTSPWLNEKGTISFRFGSGRAPGNTTKQWTSLSELKFSWTLWDYVVGRASLGQFMSWQREVTVPGTVKPNSRVTISTEVPNLPKFMPVAGAEVGLTLDPLRIPIELSVGFMADGTSTIYKRAGIFGHFELFDALNVGIGIEGMLYTHDLSADIATKKATYHDFHPEVKDGTSLTETAGFVGPSLEIGWHF
jgi:hypothetical protein